MRDNGAPTRRNIRFGSLNALDTRLERLARSFCGFREPMDTRSEGSDGVEVDLHALRGKRMSRELLWYRDTRTDSIRRISCRSSRSFPPRPWVSMPSRSFRSLANACLYRHQSRSAHNAQAGLKTMTDSTLRIQLASCGNFFSISSNNISPGTSTISAGSSCSVGSSPDCQGASCCCCCCC